jgi:hypothetical protein
MNLLEAKQRRDDLVARTLDIEAELAAMKLRWYTNGETDHVRRATLEAERATIAIEKNALYKQINAAKKAQRAHLESLQHATLIRLLHERGMSDLVAEARRIAVDQRIDA